MEEDKCRRRCAPRAPSPTRNAVHSYTIGEHMPIAFDMNNIFHRPNTGGTKVKMNEWLNKTAVKYFYNTTYAHLRKAHARLVYYVDNVAVDKEGKTNNSDDNYCENNDTEDNNSDDSTDGSNDNIDDGVETP